MAAFTDEDLDNPTEINFKGKERIVRASGKSMEEVNKLLVSYKQTLIVQQWLQLKYVPLMSKLPFCCTFFLIDQHSLSITHFKSNYMYSRRKSLGEPIPSTQQEMRQMQEGDARISGIAQKV